MAEAKETGRSTGPRWRLDRHEASRRAGRPTVSVLVGSEPETSRHWWAWCRRAGRDPLRVEGTRAAAVAAAAAEGLLDAAAAEDRLAPYLRAPDEAAGEALLALAAVADRHPALACALGLSPAAHAALAARPEDDRIRGLLRDGAVVLQPEGPPSDRVRMRLAGRGAPAPLLEAFDAAVHAHRAAARAPAAGRRALEDRALSAAERFLFAVLEWREATRGAFRLNVAAGPRRASGRPLEVDLLDRHRGVAVELDGPYHFRDVAAYRRDREKDWLLQRAGFTILRFLSAEVVADLERILARIDAARAGHRGTRPEGKDER